MQLLFRPLSLSSSHFMLIPPFPRVSRESRQVSASVSFWLAEQTQHFWSQEHGIILFGKDLHITKPSNLPSPITKPGQLVPYPHLLNTSRDRDSTISQGSLYQCKTTLSTKKLILMFNLSLAWFTWQGLRLFPRVPSLVTWKKSNNRLTASSFHLAQHLLLHLNNHCSLSHSS